MATDPKKAELFYSKQRKMIFNYKTVLLLGTVVLKIGVNLKPGKANETAATAKNRRMQKRVFILLIRDFLEKIVILTFRFSIGRSVFLRPELFC